MEKFKCEDVLQCVNGESVWLTEGRLYMTLGARKGPLEDVVDIIDDTGHIHPFSVSRFIKIVVKEYEVCDGLVDLLLPKPTTRPMTAKEIAMLPRGTKFHFYQDDNEDVFVYNPIINEKGIWGSNLEGKIITKNFEELRGYQLPDEEEIRPFTVDTSPLTTEEILREIDGRG